MRDLAEHHLPVRDAAAVFGKLDSIDVRRVERRREEAA